MTSGLQRIRVWIGARPRQADAVLAVVVAVVSVGVHLGSAHVDHEHEVADPSVLGVVLTLAATLPVAWRRTHPVAVLAVVGVAQFTLEAVEAIGPGWIGVLIASYSLGAHHTGRHTSWIAVVFTASATLFVITGIVVGDAPWAALISTLVIFPAAIVFGDSIRRRRERLVEMRDRAERAERERELLARQELHEDRTRIARELHDVVAHSLSVMVIQAGAARRQLDADTTRARAALETIEATGRDALDEMRRILGVLRRDEDADRAPAPSLAMLPELTAADPSLPVTLRMVGDVSDVPSGVELNAYRVVQEALTNTRRHAGKVGSVAVNVVRRDATLDVEVIDDGRGASTLVNSTRTGHGIVGMRERVEAAGGRLTAGPRQGGGWRVHAVFPVPTQVPVTS